MNLQLDNTLGKKYKSEAQKIRVMSESWAVKNIFCPCCGNPHLIKLKNNEAAADMKCEQCGGLFELKSKKGKIGKKISNGAYSTMIERITSITNPELLVLQYSSDYVVTDLTLVPKFFFVPPMIEKRKALSPTAQRAGWTGCNILYSQIPPQGKIGIIENGGVKSKSDIIENYAQLKRLAVSNIDSRSWLMDVLDCVNNLKSKEFCLREIYAYVEILRQKHRNNHNIEAKVRQQLQFLRDKGFIEFLGGGYYRKRF